MNCNCDIDDYKSIPSFKKSFGSSAASLRQYVVIVTLDSAVCRVFGAKLRRQNLRYFDKPAANGYICIGLHQLKVIMSLIRKHWIYYLHIERWGNIYIYAQLIMIN